MPTTSLVATIAALMALMVGFYDVFMIADTARGVHEASFALVCLAIVTVTAVSPIVRRRARGRNAHATHATCARQSTTDRRPRARGRGHQGAVNRPTREKGNEQ